MVDAYHILIKNNSYGNRRAVDEIGSFSRLNDVRSTVWKEQYISSSSYPVALIGFCADLPEIPHPHPRQMMLRDRSLGLTLLDFSLPAPSGDV